jgi:hypothetical protein
MPQLVIDVPESHELPDTEYPYTYENAVAHAVAVVVKEEDGSLTLRREVGLHFTDPEDQDDLIAVIQNIEEKLDEVANPKRLVTL